MLTFFILGMFDRFQLESCVPDFEAVVQTFVEFVQDLCTGSILKRIGFNRDVRRQGRHATSNRPHVEIVNRHNSLNVGHVRPNLIKIHPGWGTLHKHTECVAQQK